ncbi:unnamed protein product [Brassica oleracea]|uniref:(rape) hypothetical protein n=1 Tax=Brassica napus TaxID=3708 RepID=A0A816KTN4_BRANA|nr:unnamed protein product [Brassica napus]
MTITKTLVTLFLVVALTASLFNSNILASDVEKTKYTFCAKSLCTDSYTLYMCMTDCAEKGYSMGACIVPSPNAPLRCCCTP